MDCHLEKLMGSDIPYANRSLSVKKDRCGRSVRGRLLSTLRGVQNAVRARSLRRVNVAPRLLSKPDDACAYAPPSWQSRATRRVPDGHWPRLPKGMLGHIVRVLDRTQIAAAIIGGKPTPALGSKRKVSSAARNACSSALPGFSISLAGPFRGSLRVASPASVAPPQGSKGRRWNEATVPRPDSRTGGSGYGRGPLTCPRRTWKRYRPTAFHPRFRR